jgi:hypothetical protein
LEEADVLNGKETVGRLHVRKFTPVARPDDPVWQDRPIWADFKIVAATAGEAILLARRYDACERAGDVQGAEVRELRSGLEDPLLYRLDRLEAVDPLLLPRGTVVSRGRFLPKP